MDFQTDTDGKPCTFENHYHCPDCDTEWTDWWSCACDDECPSCGYDISPCNWHDHAAPTYEPGAEGMPQAVIPGAEREPVRQTLERKMEGGKRSEKPQREPGGLFGDASRQLDLF